MGKNDRSYRGAGRRLNPPLVYVIVLNWNGKELIRECLHSLGKVTYNNTCVLVVDNGSIDNTVGMIKQDFPWVEILALPSNLGFAAGNNAGFKYVKEKRTDYIIFLNNDTIVDPEFIQPLIELLETKADIGQTVSKIFYADDPERIWYAGGKVNLWTGMIYHRGIRRMDSEEYNQRQQTDYATGCCFCMRSIDFNSLGGFDESFHMYSEDTDLSLRLKREGKTVFFVPESKIWHKVSVSIGGAFSIRKIKKKLLSKWRLFQIHTNNYQKVCIIFIWVFTLFPFYLLKWGYLKLMSGMK